MVFVGDTMFAMGCGRLFEGTAEQMYRIAPADRGAAARDARSIARTNIRWRTRASRPMPSRAIDAIAERLAAVEALRDAGEDHGPDDRR